MCKVIDEFQIGKYTVLGLDKPITARAYRRYRIDGKVYEIVPVYDAPKCIAIEAEGSFLGKTVEFIL